MDMSFIFNLENLHFGSVEHQSDIFWVSHLSTWHARVFFSPLVFCFYVFNTFVFIFIALNFYAVFPFTKKQSASHRKIKQHSAFRLPTARDDPNFNFHFDFHFHFGSKSPRWLRVGWGDALLYTIYDILYKEYINIV